jgi:deoxyribose-phosphate aldolase
MRDACGNAHIKVILATGECGTMQKVMQASLVCMMAGADFIKTSTGKEGVNATFETGFCMVIRNNIAAATFVLFLLTQDSGSRHSRLS